MANHTDRWYFSKEKIQNSPSIKDGIERSKELGYRQQCANLVQDIGQRLQVNQLVINTAIVYMHRFYMHHSFQKYHRNVMAPCFVFLAAKVEEMPRKLEHVLKASHVCLKKEEPPLDVKSDDYMQLSQELVNNESALLQTLGFEVSVDHPNTFVVKCAQLVKASKELAQTAYFLATNSLHLTTFCVQYKPTLVACVCIYVSCLWANYIIPETDGKNWFEFIEPTCTKKQLEDLSSYFIKILDSCPTRLKKRLTAGGAVVYKEGKVMQKQETSGKDKTDSTPSSNKNNNTSNSNNNNSTSKSNSNNNHDSSSKSSTKAISKTHLTGMLKPQSHESTPPPSSGRSSSHHNHHQGRKHDDKNHQESGGGKKGDVPTTHKDMKQHKTQEQIKLEHKRKILTPEQFEEYKKRKEREKLQYYQKKYKQQQEAEKQQQQNHINGNGNSNTPQKSIRPNSHLESPAKRQKLDSSKASHNQNNKNNTDNHRKNIDRPAPAGFSKLSSSGSDSEPITSKSQHNSKHKSNQKLNHMKSTPIKMNGNSKTNDIHMAQPPGGTNSRYNLPPPPPPPVPTKYA